MADSQAKLVQLQSRSNREDSSISTAICMLASRCMLSQLLRYSSSQCACGILGVLLSCHMPLSKQCTITTSSP